MISTTGNAWSSHVAITATFSALLTHHTPAVTRREPRPPAVHLTDARGHFQALIFPFPQAANAVQNATIVDSSLFFLQMPFF